MGRVWNGIIQAACLCLTTFSIVLNHGAVHCARCLVYSTVRHRPFICTRAYHHDTSTCIVINSFSVNHRLYILHICTLRTSNPRIVPIYGLRTSNPRMRGQSVVCGTNHGSEVCAGQSLDCANPCFAHNIYTLQIASANKLVIMSDLSKQVLILNAAQISIH